MTNTNKTTSNHSKKDMKTISVSPDQEPSSVKELREKENKEKAETKIKPVTLPDIITNKNLEMFGEIVFEGLIPKEDTPKSPIKVWVIKVKPKSDLDYYVGRVFKGSSNLEEITGSNYVYEAFESNDMKYAANKEQFSKGNFVYVPDAVLDLPTE